MLNLKKSLAIVMAAATALTFAPVANLGAPVQAEAAEHTSDLTTGGVLTDIYAFKNASYDLAEHAAVKYDGRNYSNKELTWYLVESTNTLAVGDQRADLKDINLDSSAGTISSGTTGSLKITINDANAFKNAVDKAEEKDKDGKVTSAAKKTVVVAQAYVDGVKTIVYKSSSTLSVTVLDSNTKFVSKTLTDSVNDQTVYNADSDLGKGTQKVLDKKIPNPTKDNIYMHADEVNYPTDTYKAKGTSLNYTLTVKSDNDASKNPFAGSTLKRNGDKNLAVGTYYETQYIPFKVGNGDTLYIQKVEITVTVGTSIQFRVKDGDSILATTYGETKATDPTVYLNLTDNKTWNIKDHLTTDAIDPSKVTYAFDSDSSNADVDANGVITAKSVGNAKITIKVSYNGLTNEAPLMVRVSQNGFDTLTVTGNDKDTARVLNTRDFENNNVAGASVNEEKLVTRQIPYVQIEINGNDSTNVVESPVVTSANKATLHYSFVEDYSKHGLTINPDTGAITVDYTHCTDAAVADPDKSALGVYAVKVVSDATSKSENTTSYFYVVVDYPDQKITGIEDAYTIGTCNKNEAHILNINLTDKAEYARAIGRDGDDFKGAPLYGKDNVAAFDQTFDQKSGSTPGGIRRATAVDQTEHVIAYNSQKVASHKGYTAKLVTVKSVAGLRNFVKTITNKKTGEVIYDSAKNSGDAAAKIHVSDITTISVTLGYPVGATTGSSIGIAIDSGNLHDGNIVNQTTFVTAVKNKNNVDIVLYPNTRGTQVIWVNPTGDLSATDKSIVDRDPVNLAIEYDGTTDFGAEKPAKVAGVKVANKKGAKVSVSWTSQGGSVNYRVYKKVGNGKWIAKNVTSNKATLSVKKGAKVQVKVKAFVKDSTGTTTWGPKATKKTFKTDKK